MVVIGLTGNIGTGKTTVSQILAKLGAVIVDADKVGHELLQPHTQTWREVVSVFGKNILKANEEIDRSKLGEIVFNNPEALAILNRIMHPKMFPIVKKRIEDEQRKGAKAIILEAPLLIEAGWSSLVHQIWVTTAPEAIIVERLKKQKGLNEAQVLARLRSQMPQEAKIKQAHQVIDTDCSLADLETKVTQLWHQLNQSQRLLFQNTCDYLKER